MSYMSMADEDWAELSLSSFAYTSSIPAQTPPQITGFRLREFSHHCPRTHHPFSPPPPPPLYAPNNIHTHLPPPGIPFTRHETTTNNGGGCLATATTFAQDQEETTKKKIRLMRNRESAVRSRARKQAYTSELEREVARLVKENDQLKKQLEENGNGDENKQKTQMSEEVQMHHMKKKRHPQFQRAASAPL